MLSSVTEEIGMAQDKGLLLSVIVPTYNYASNLAICLTSVLKQLNRESELIVIDDGSTDETKAIVEGLTPKDHCAFVYAWQANGGAASARNHGLRLARGAYVLFLDADDQMMPGTADTVCAYLKTHPETDLLIGGHVTHRRDGQQKTAMPSKPAPEKH